jgi:hypothetical protein
MLIRVESYPDNKGNIGATIHACLATASNDGIMFQAGRKLGDVTFGSDRTVSRKHCHVRCVGTLSGMQKPRNPKEKEACSENGGMCLVLENLGKAGTFIAKEDKDQQRPIAVPDDDIVTDDDETDDEGISQQSRRLQSQASVGLHADLPPISSATRLSFGTKPVKLEKMDKDDQVVFSVSPESPEVMIQLGRLESTIKLSLVEMKVSFSSMKRASDFQTAILPKLHQIGAHQIDDDKSRPNLLVTQELNAGAKQIIAWSLQIPIVTQDYLKALLNRKSVSDPLPDPSNFKVTESSDKSIDFWSKYPNIKLLENFTLLSVEPGTFEIMAVAAGAKLVALHEQPLEEDQFQQARDILSTANGETIYIMQYSRKRVFKKISLLLGVHRVDIKKLAKTVCHQLNYLIDTDGAKLSVRTLMALKDKNNNASQISKLTSCMKTPQEASQPPAEEEESTPPETSMIETQCLLDPSSQPVLTNVPPAPNIVHSDNTNQGFVNDTRKQVPPTIMEEGESPEEEEQPKKKAKKSTTTATTIKKSPFSSEDKLTGADKNGWFVAAPKEDSKRKEWRQRSTKLLKEGGLEYIDPAETETITIVTSSGGDDGSFRLPTRRVRNRNVPDFRRFQKNIVPKADYLVSVTAFKEKEAQDREAYDEQERGLAEEQRRADALFRGDGTLGGTRKRRRRID